MPNPYFQFKQFTVFHDRTAMKVTTDACLFGAWCAAQLEPTLQKGERILDLGTGTGLLSLMMAQKTGAMIDAVELEPEAALQAQQNFRAAPWPDRIRLLHQDARQLPDEPRYRYIISNPPFYEGELFSSSRNRNMAHHSAELPIADLFRIIERKMEPGGSFFLLLPSKRMATLEPHLRRNWQLLKLTVVAPSPLHPPIRVMLMAGGKAAAAEQSERINIRDEQQQYTPEFTSLLKDYYLYL